MGAPADISYETKVTFGTSAVVLQMRDISIGGISRDKHEITHQESPEPGAAQFGGREYLFDVLAEPGEITVTGNHNPDQVPPVKGPVEQIDVETRASGSDTTGAKWSGNGAVISYDVGLDRGAPGEFTMVVAWTGLVDVTVGS